MMLAVGIRYLTGYAVATDVSDRHKAEWPPHPGRIFMAMAAAHFETGEEADERAALQWLERQTPPAMKIGDVQRRDVVTCYVPPNDHTLPKNPQTLKPEAVGAAMMILPSYRTNKQPRTFPRVRLQDDTIYLLWPDAAPDEACRAALDQICSKVTRIGHSSSLVQMWVAHDPLDRGELTATLETASPGEHRLRIVSEGTLQYLKSTYNLDAIDAYADLRSKLATAKGKAKSLLKKELDDRFDGRAPTTLRPTISLWQGYRRVSGSTGEHQYASGAFNSELIVLTIQDGPVVGLETTWQLLTALRNTIIKTCDPVPEWVSGHGNDNTPSQKAHLALMPLGFVGCPHADGHLMGVGLSLPKGIGSQEFGQVLGKLLYDHHGQPRTITLVLGSLGKWTLQVETRPSRSVMLQTKTWIGPSKTWATVTPIVLDRHPKADRAKKREKWSWEVAQIIAVSCQQQGLPMPVGIDIDKTCWHRGGLRAVQGKDSGYPLMPVKDGRSFRQQVHAWLRFDHKIEGPLLLGAGRYRGYGLCKPWNGGGR